MRLSPQLPIPLTGKSGWPWTEADSCPKIAEERKDWPKISIITPSFNQGEFIEETIRSVLLQNYPNLEYIVVDGSSTDGSVQIIKKYERWLTYWVSEQDNGQSHAINKGFSRAKGDIFGWLNSDDLLKPNALFKVATAIAIEKESWLIGAAEIVDKSKEHLSVRHAVKVDRSYELFINWNVFWFAQQSTFWSDKLFKKVGLLDESLHYIMDVEFWYRFRLETPPEIIRDVLPIYRCHEQAKTIANNYESQREFLEWLKKTIFKQDHELDEKIGFVLTELRRVQVENQQLENLKGHIVIGKIIKFWKKFINPDLSV